MNSPKAANTTVTNLEKRIKRNIYGKPQSILVIYPPGFSKVAQDEVQFIMENLWFQNKFPTEMTVLKNALRIDQIHMFAVLELIMRGQCFTDIRLILGEGKVEKMLSFENKCDKVEWDFFTSPDMSLKINVDSGASPSLHEGAMKDKLVACLKSKIKRIVSGENVEETTTVFVDVYKYQLTMSISLAGAALYKRGYRSVLSNSAPLREDMAACCILKALQFSATDNQDFINDYLLVPFSGTGTFLFEYVIACYQFAPALLQRTYAIQAMPLFNSENFNFLLKKARENCSVEKMQPGNFYCVDNVEAANKALLNNIENFNKAVELNQLKWNGAAHSNWCANDDFLKMDVVALYPELTGNIFIPINPPYGIRLGKNDDTVTLYKQIAKQVNALSVYAKKQGKQVAGFILCPGEGTWSGFCKTLSKAKIETYHITQGGLDIRVAQFCIG
jgi:23S rRNA G2445 N2-methylase RlmL